MRNGAEEKSLSRELVFFNDEEGDHFDPGFREIAQYDGGHPGMGDSCRRKKGRMSVLRSMRMIGLKDGFFMAEGFPLASVGCA